MRSYIILPLVAFGVLTAASLQAAYPAKWSGSDDSYQLVMQYRADAFVLDHGLTREDCTQALPYGDDLKHVHFTCEVEG